MATAKTFVLDPAMAFENGGGSASATVGSITYYKVGNGARWKWTTSARWLVINCYAEYSSAFVNNGRMGVIVNGTVLTPLGAPQATGAYTTRVRLPVGAAKTVELFIPLQYAASAGGARLGVYPYFVQFDEDATEISPTYPGDHLVIYGDSIASGGVAICPCVQGYAGLMKNGAYSGNVTLISYGTRRLNDDCATAGAATSFVTSMLALNPTKVLVAIGSNDHSVTPPVTVANFRTYYDRLLDEIHSQSASMPIVCLSPIRRSTEGTNSNGETMAQFRTAISDSVAARSGWGVPPTYENGLAIFADLSLLPDSVHPGATGNVTLKNAVVAMV